MREKAQQPRLINKLNYVPTIHPACIYDDKPSCLPLSSQPREPLNQLAFQQDERMLYKASFTAKSFENIGELLVEFLDSDCKCSIFYKHIVYYRLSIPQITECIRINSDLHVMLF